MEKPNVVVIVVQGGAVQQVCVKAPQDLEVILVDWDNIGAGDRAHYVTPEMLRDLDPETARQVVDLAL